MKPPHITEELLVWLDATYPNECPRPTMTGREVWMAAGAADVVTKLKQLFRDQSRRDMNQ